MDPPEEDDVFRTRPLPEAAARGRLIVPESIALDTGIALRSFRGDDGPHEGIVFWGGLGVGANTVISAAVVPKAEHGWGRVHVPEHGVGAAARALRPYGIGMIAQVHSHPGRGTRHSDGDDELVLMPFEGMFSLVVGRYGADPIDAGAGIGVHQFQDGRWVFVTDSDRALVVVPRLMWS